MERAFHMVDELFTWGTHANSESVARQDAGRRMLSIESV